MIKTTLAQLLKSKIIMNKQVIFQSLVEFPSIWNQLFEFYSVQKILESSFYSPPWNYSPHYGIFTLIGGGYRLSDQPLGWGRAIMERSRFWPKCDMISDL